MPDEAQLQVVIEAQVDRVLAGMSQFQRSLDGIGAAHVATGQQADQHGAKVEAFIGKMERLADVGKLFAAWEIIERVMGSFVGLENFNIDLLRTTEILGGNAQAASTWVVIAQEMGISVETIDRGFAKLSAQINSASSPALKQMGIASEDTKGNLRSLNEVLGDVADYFHAHAGAANEAALANELFGKSGYTLLPALEQGRAGIQAITDEAKKYGLILDAETVQRNAAFTFQLKEAQLAAEGLEVSLGNALLPGLAALGQAFSRVVADNLPAFIAAINRAVSYVIGFVEGLTGMTLQVDQGAAALSSLSQIAGDTGTGLDGAASASQALADAEQRVRDQAKDATSALDDQIRALNAGTAASQFTDKQAKLQEDTANKGRDIQKLQQREYQEYWLGNFVTAQDLTDQITKAKEEQADLFKQIDANTNDEQTKGKVAALESQKRSIQNAADEQIQAMQKAGRATTDAMAGAASSFAPLFAKGGAAAADQLKFALVGSAEDTGHAMATQLMDALFGEQQIIWDKKGEHILEVHGRAGGGNWTKIGGAIGDALGTAMATAMGKQLSRYWNSVEATVLTGKAGDANFDKKALVGDLEWLKSAFSFDKGGMVPGPPGSAQFAIVHGGEQVLTPEQQAGGNGDVVAVLRAILGELQSRASQPAGMEAALYNAIESSKDWRRRGVIGATR